MDHVDVQAWVWQAPSSAMQHAQDCPWVAGQQTNPYVHFDQVPPTRLHKHVYKRPICDFCVYSLP